MNSRLRRYQKRKFFIQYCLFQRLIEVHQRYLYRRWSFWNVSSSLPSVNPFQIFVNKVFSFSSKRRFWLFSLTKFSPKWPKSFRYKFSKYTNTRQSLWKQDKNFWGKFQKRQWVIHSNLDSVKHAICFGTGSNVKKGQEYFLSCSHNSYCFHLFSWRLVTGKNA